MAALSEFALIAQYFDKLTSQRNDVVKGIGDDCALLQCPTDKTIAVSIDTLVEGVHFFADVDPEKLGYKSLAVGLSDLAAMGATPAWFTLALTLPDVNENWLAAFSKGLAKLANLHNIQLVGGDTTKGTLTISIQVHGHVKPRLALQRSGAQVGDLIYVTGTLGDAGVALHTKLHPDRFPELSEQETSYLTQRLELPTPRVDSGLQLLGIATSAIDISDGLAADLIHILEASNVGASIELVRLPISVALQKLDSEQAYQFALTAGDDYELCFTVPADKQTEFETRVEGYSLIGKIEAEVGLRMLDNNGQLTTIIGNGYDHFTS